PPKLTNLLETRYGLTQRHSGLCCAPKKKDSLKQKRLAPWFNSATRKLKQTTRQLERIWRSTKEEDSRLAWKEKCRAFKRCAPKTCRLVFPGFPEVVREQSLQLVLWNQFPEA
ncbi:hypothetical protein L3Q82_024475, partial [Scortum barcoo]